VIEKKIIVCTGTDRDKNLRVRLSLLLVEDGVIISEQYHSVAVGPGDDLVGIREALEAHIGSPSGGVPGAPWPKVPEEEWAEVEAHGGIVFTPERVARRLARMEAADGPSEKKV